MVTDGWPMGCRDEHDDGDRWVMQVCTRYVCVCVQGVLFFQGGGSDKCARAVVEALWL